LKRLKLSFRGPLLLADMGLPVTIVLDHARPLLGERLATRSRFVSATHAPRKSFSSPSIRRGLAPRNLEDPGQQEHQQYEKSRQPAARMVTAPPWEAPRSASASRDGQRLQHPEPLDERIRVRNSGPARGRHLSGDEVEQHLRVRLGARWLLRICRATDAEITPTSSTASPPTVGAY